MTTPEIPTKPDTKRASIHLKALSPLTDAHHHATAGYWTDDPVRFHELEVIKFLTKAAAAYGYTLVKEAANGND